jgi:hypothetical protein
LPPSETWWTRENTVISFPGFQGRASTAVSGAVPHDEMRLWIAEIDE